MNRLEKRSLIEYLGGKYRRSRKKLKSEILAELCVKLLIGKRHARRLLSAKIVGRPKKPDFRGRPSKYQDPEFKSALKYVWKRTRYMCSRHLKSAMSEWLPCIEQEIGKFENSIHDRLLMISAPTIDRILKPYKAIKGKSLTRSGGFRDEIPIQENIWNIKIPGFMESDTVAHCGGSLMGEFINSLTMVDIASIWTEVRAVFGKASGPVVKAIEDIENSLPFDILGYDSDNGTEVLNQHVLRYFRDERIERNKPAVQVTRSREYRKNDNAHVEQRNDAVPRRWLGYERIDFVELLPLINYYYKHIVCPLINHFFPTFKLSDKIRVKNKTKRVYKAPATPYSRIMASDYVKKDKKNLLKIQHEKLNPLVLLKQETIFRKKIDSAIKTLKSGKPATGFLAIPSQAAHLLNRPQSPTPPQCSPPPGPEGAALLSEHC